MEERDETAQNSQLTLYDGGEGSAGAPAVWVKFAEGDVDELEREVRAHVPPMRTAAAVLCVGGKPLGDSTHTHGCR